MMKASPGPGDRGIKTLGAFDMTKASTVAFVALLAIASSRPARADEPQSRVTIRGTGSDVKLERAQGPVRTRSFERRALPAGALGDAIRLKAEGTDDATLIAYLSAHQADLPTIIEARVVRQLRGAGAGKEVVAYLATVAAVDIGPTGAGSRPVAASAPEPEFLSYGASPYDDDMAYGYPPVGSYGMYPARFRARPFLRRMAFPRGRVLQRGGLPRARTPRRPILQ